MDQQASHRNEPEWVAELRESCPTVSIEYFPAPRVQGRLVLHAQTAMQSEAETETGEEEG